MKNWFYQGVAKAYEGPLNDIRHKLVEEAWFVRPDGRAVTDDLKNVSPEPSAAQEVKVELAEPVGIAVEQQFPQFYGTDLTPIAAPVIEAAVIEAPAIEAPTIEGVATEVPDAPQIEGPDIGPGLEEGPGIDP
ncbi:hypothetical protein FBZ89_114137 [Nitrospirillum amazonense]|uniref:Uncharacterized protein n=1 Tax=Nitrospirillum amazonense TaxID=28077 RepID=A0A560F1N6_9PROT|nr:hypothetical protein [Nitrospirillum amazonense]TWB15543.1 hypothetical protein FBZ89_114137 [Nitrospirillum amazonense]